ncbi:hypothetical protein ES288_A11G363200v1 [Gossypium darwinii]|uniref:Uncharacterized protein n=2 Tax=Gossypium TaxID=3633 RepID=A0A5D2NIN7_GOSTO|nr:hypothetical protein ES288_A11G363200v1 [Gossypium darwinii]TYI03772.1 hypothetical protein ES332_A11G364500v1 [Gossypium tomentosum]
MEKEGENAGDSSSSEEESNGTQQELDESQTSMGQRSSEIIESITTHPSLPNQPLQQPIISPSIYNSSTKAMEWSHDERIQSHNHEQNNVVEQLLLSKFIMNKLYDPSYEAMGLPVDPHLRMFQAKYAAENKDKGNEEHR